MDYNKEKIMGYGWKLLNPYGATEYNGIETIYPLPGPNEKWGPWFVHPEPGKRNGLTYGPGWHLMITKGPEAWHAPTSWWPWFAEYRQVLGQSNEKVRVVEVRLRRVSKAVFWRIIRFGWMRRANLSWANLRGADLRWADLRKTNLFEADLRGADLRGANLRGADLRWTDLRRANLYGTDLKEINYNQYTIWPDISDWN